MIIDSLLALIAPYDCLGCATEGKILCSSCAKLLKCTPGSCYRCHAPIAEGCICGNCRTPARLDAVNAAVGYAGLAKALIWQLKFNGKQAAAREMVQQMRQLMQANEPLVIVPVPTATSRARERGYDQACLLARELAKGLPQARYTPALRRLGQHHQVGANRQQRLQQLQQAYYCKNSSQVHGTNVVLIDDVLTTGATLEAAAKVMNAAGAKTVSAVVFAQA